jgi:hypothetical protein
MPITYPTITEWFAMTEEQASQWYDDHNVGRTVDDENFAKPRFFLTFANEADYNQWWIDFEYSDQLECERRINFEDGTFTTVITPQI